MNTRIKTICLTILSFLVVFTIACNKTYRIPTDSIGKLKSGKITIISKNSPQFKTELKNIINKVESANDYYDISYTEDDFNKFMENGFNSKVTFSKVRNIRIPKLKTTLECKAIIIPRNNDFLPLDSVVVVNEGSKINILASK